MAGSNDHIQADILYGINPDLKVHENTMRQLYNAKGLYSRADIEDAKYNKFSRFGRIIDADGRLNDTRQYLFFVKPDLHICQPGSDGTKINAQLANSDYFQDLVARYPQVVRELQYSASASNSVFSNLLSFGVNSNLDMPGMDADTMDTPSTMYGVHYDYLMDTESSNYNPTFSLEFVDSRELELYHFFKAYAEYHIIKKTGAVTPPSKAYLQYRRLHNTMGVYKFLVDEDMETIIYYAYYWGVIPTSVPREAFSDSSFSDGLTFSINFKAAFVDDSKPTILKEFNNKMSKLVSQGKYSPIYVNAQTDDGYEGINGTLPIGAQVVQANSGRSSGRSVFKLLWYEK